MLLAISAVFLFSVTACISSITGQIISFFHSEYSAMI
jgi:hypothetical protein